MISLALFSLISKETLSLPPGEVVIASKFCTTPSQEPETAFMFTTPEVELIVPLFYQPSLSVVSDKKSVNICFASTLVS